MRTDLRQPYPYAPPSAHFDDVASGIYEPKFFAFQGRIGRVRFLAYASLAVVMAFGLLFVGLTIADAEYPIYHDRTAFDIACVVLYSPLVAAPLVYVRRRFHDIGVSSWQSLMLFVPLLGIWAIVYIACTRGTTGPNAHGPAPRSNRAITATGAMVLPLLALACLSLAILNLLAVY